MTMTVISTRLKPIYPVPLVLILLSRKGQVCRQQLIWSDGLQGL